MTVENMVRILLAKRTETEHDSKVTEAFRKALK